MLTVVLAISIVSTVVHSVDNGTMLIVRGTIIMVLAIVLTVTLQCDMHWYHAILYYHIRNILELVVFGTIPSVVLTNTGIMP